MTGMTSELHALTHSMTNAGDWARMSADRFPDRVCLIDESEDGTRRLTFQQVADRVDAIAAELAGRYGLKHGDRLAIMAVDSNQYVELWMACSRIGVTAIPLNYRLSPGEVRNLLERGSARALAASDQYVDLALQMQRDVGQLQHIVSMRSDDRVQDSVEAMAERGGTPPERRVHDDDLFSISFTSGTTGRAKGVMQSQRMMKMGVPLMSVEYEVQGPDSEFRYSASPMFHIAGVAMVMMGILYGYPQLIRPQFDAERTLWWMREGKLTAVFLVPTMVHTVLDLPGAEEGAFPHLQTILYGGSSMPPALLRRAMKIFGCDFVNAFGAGTEAGLQAVLTAADHRRAAAGEEHLLESVGRPAFGVRMRLTDPHMNDVPRGEVGEITTRGEFIMNGYLDMPEETAEALRGGWFRAGDLARMDDEGYLYLAGRAKDMIIRGGENVYPVEIESTLAEHPSVGSVAVIGVPDERWGETVGAVVVPSQGVTCDPGELQEFCAGRLAKYKVPERIWIREEMPLNASGKILKRVLRDDLATSAEAV